MTNRKNLRITLAVAAVTITSVFVLSSWDYKNNYMSWNDDDYYDQYDTVPKKQNREKKIRDLDDVIDELNGVDMKMDWEKMQKELNESMKKLDMQKIQLDMEKTMKNVDFEKIQKEIEQSMAKIDFVNMEKEMANAMKEVESSMKKIDWEKMKTEMEKVKDIDMKKMEIDMKKMEEEMKKLGPELEKSLENAKESIEKAKVEMKEYNEFVNGLEKDGLLKRSEGYTIKHRDGELFINGKKASDATYNKYKNFLEKHKTFSIEKTDDDFDMDID